MEKEYSAGFILFRSDQESREYLLLHYKGGHYDFPKGHLEAGEDELTAAKRELHEETGITQINIFDDFEKHLTYQFHRGPYLIEKKVTFFLAETSEKDVTISHEHLDYIWLPYEQAVLKVTFPNARSILVNAEKYLIN